MLHLQYPIGKFEFEKEISDNEIQALIAEIEKLPHQLRQVVQQLTQQQMEIPYRTGGWKVKQVVHHLVDSHMNAYIRLNLMLTETQPTIKPYAEKLWAQLPYKEDLSIETALTMLEMVHIYLSAVLRSLSNEQLNHTYLHPEYNRIYTLRKVIALYAWHGKHHLAHITKLMERNFDQ